MEIVDTHAHLYSEDEKRYPMKQDPLRPPPGTGTITHLKRVTRQAGVTKVVAIQTGTAYMYDNSFMADTVSANSDWMRGVCTLDPDDPKSPFELTRLVTEHGVKGVRLGFTGREPRDGLRELWKTAERLAVNVCAHFRGSEPAFRMLAGFLSLFPQVPVILDHSAYISASEAPDHTTLKGVLTLRAFTNLYPKLSFLASGSQEPYPCRDTHPLARQLIDAFGPDHCTYGSGFPTELWIPKVTYEQHLSIFTEAMFLTEDERRAILETTPTRLWFR